MPGIARESGDRNGSASGGYRRRIKVYNYSRFRRTRPELFPLFAPPRPRPPPFASFDGFRSLTLTWGFFALVDLELLLCVAIFFFWFAFSRTRVWTARRLQAG